MLSFTAPRTPPWLVVKTGSTIAPGERLTLGRQASLIVPRLYLSNLFTARDPVQLTKLGVTHVLSVVEDAPNIPSNLGLRTLHVPIRDEVDVDILGYLDETTDWIKAALSENISNTVLVHCLVGMSRSATVVCAYILATTNMTPSQSISFVASKRSVVSPNVGFRKQLEQYYWRLHPDMPKSQSHPDASTSQLRLGLSLGKLRLWRTSASAASNKTGKATQKVQTSTSLAMASTKPGESPKVVGASIDLAPHELQVTELLNSG